MNADLKSELEEVKMANYAIASLLFPPVSVPLSSIVDNGDGTVYVRYRI